MFKKTSQANNLEVKDEKRQHLREPDCKMLKLQPLNVEGQPEGRAFWAYSKDFSEKGFAFQINKFVDFGLLEISVVEDDFSGKARVQHVSKNHGQEFTFTVGCEMIPEDASQLVSHIK